MSLTQLEQAQSEIAGEDKELQKAFLVGKYVYLRPPERRDVEGRWYQWFNDSKVTRYLRRGAFPNTREEQIKFFESIGKNQSEVILAIVDKKTHSHIGVISLRGIDWISRLADIAVIIGEKEYWAKLHAIESMALMTDHGFKRLNLHKIKATQHEALDGWRKYLEAIGYKTEGILKKEIFTDGKYSDIHQIAIFEEDYQRLCKERNGSLAGDSLYDLVKSFVRSQRSAK